MMLHEAHDCIETCHSKGCLHWDHGGDSLTIIMPDVNPLWETTSANTILSLVGKELKHPLNWN